MDKKNTIKESCLLQYLVQSGDAVDTFRNAVLECVCKLLKIQDYEQYINDEARIKYIYQPWEREDDLSVELYSRKEYDPEKEYKNILQENEVCHQRQPRMVAYSLAFRAIMPVSEIESYIRENYLIFEETCFSVKKR